MPQEGNVPCTSSVGARADGHAGSAFASDDCRHGCRAGQSAVQLAAGRQPSLTGFGASLRQAAAAAELHYRAQKCFNRITETGVLHRSGAEKYPRTRSG